MKIRIPAGKVLALSLLTCAAAGLLSGCGGKGYADGTYEGRSEIFVEEEINGNGYGIVRFTVEKHKITDCTFTTYEEDGTEKDENYGQDGGTEYCNKAQKAVAACAEYAKQFAADGNTDGIDSISGATINCEAFKEAVKNAEKQ